MNYKINTNIGVVREENQDRATVIDNNIGTLALLCDGMGGHFGGSLAASITINTFSHEMESLPNDKKHIFEWFKNVIKQCKNNMITEAGNDAMKKDMGTTVTAAIIYKNTKDIFIFNIGDSRTYIFDGLLHQITVDHNLMNYYIIEENMSEFQAAKLPGAAALTSALGPNKKTNIEAFTIDYSNEKRTIILTSDGIHDYITKPNFEMIVSGSGNLSEKTDQLINQAIRGESTDNLTIIMLEVE
ncbi:MAG: serine/threonine-protein phosphatase [Mycoplasmataceae bacterium]|nr:serine/threonine-protein phosphatase [Mycoplasmataceae bacterium]